MRILVIAAVLLGFIAPAAAQSEADRSAVQAVIGQQLDAFLSDDAATAYSFAAPNIQTMFPTQDRFMELVQQGYQPVYRSKSRSFGELKETAMGLEQTVDLVDAAGEFWTAVYTLQRQPDGSWKISSCVLVKKPGEVA
jgi:ketosteroid isomerase-like protein